jgi:hypothetical protein
MIGTLTTNPLLRSHSKQKAGRLTVWKIWVKAERSRLCLSAVGGRLASRRKFQPHVFPITLQLKAAYRSGSCCSVACGMIRCKAATTSRPRNFDSMRWQLLGCEWGASFPRGRETAAEPLLCGVPISRERHFCAARSVDTYPNQLGT